MSDPATPEPPPPPPERRSPSRLQRATAIVATVGIVVALVGLVLLLRPVSTPVQDCGTSLGFLLDGRTNVYADPDDLPKGVTAAEAKANNERPCRERVADGAVPAAGMIAGGVALGVVAALVEVVDRSLDRKHRRESAGAGATP